MALFNFSRPYYTPDGTNALSEKQLRKEYSRLRSIAVKRLERLGKSKFNKSEAYLSNIGKFLSLKEINTNRELRFLTSDIYRFLSAEQSSVTGQKNIQNRTIKTLNENGFKNINESNFQQFTDFMEYARIVTQNSLYDSGDLADFFTSKFDGGLSQKQIRDAYLNWKEDEKNVIKIQNFDPRNSSMYKNEL